MGSGPNGAVQALDLVECILQWLSEGSGHAGQCKQFHTSSNNIRNGGYCPPSRLYRSIIVEVTKDY